MELEKVSGVSTTSSMDAELGEDNRWTVVMKLTQGRLLKGSTEWEYKATSVKSIDLDLEMAITRCNTSIMLYLEELDGSLFNEDKLLEDKDAE